MAERNFTTFENELQLIKKNALAEINSDTLFEIYESTQLNLIPIIIGNEKNVYILTGTQQNVVVIFGNYYLLTFNKNNKLTHKSNFTKPGIF